MYSSLATRIVFPSKQQVQLEEFSIPAMGETQILAKSVCSLISTGTETTILNGTFDPGTHWHDWVKYPFFPGYSTVAKVESVGSGVKTVRPGELVAIRGSHASHHVINEDKAIPIPAGVAAEEAVWFALAKIAFVGARAAAYRLGESVVIVGCGPIGQLSIRWAKAAGQRFVCAIDTAEQRLAVARDGGANVTLCASAADAKQAIIEQCGAIPSTIIDTTGHPKVFADVLRLSGDRGRVVLLGDAGSPDQQHLTPDLITKGLTITAGHDIHIPEAEAGPVYQTFFSLVKSGQMNLKGLNTHFSRPADCSAAYDSLNTRRAQTMGVLFNWN